MGRFDSEATLKFSQDAYYPSASTCALQLVLPTQYHNNESLFKQTCSFAFINLCGFGMYRYLGGSQLLNSIKSI